MRYRFEREDLSLLHIFLEEAREHIGVLEKDLIHLEDQQEKGELVDGLFRSVHSIKGDSSFVGITCITKIAHQVESILDGLRKRQVQANKELVDVLLQAIDVINVMIGSIEDQVRQLDIGEEKGNNPFDIELHLEEEVNGIVKEVQRLISTQFTEAAQSEGAEKEEKKISTKVFESDELKQKMSKEFIEQFIIETLEHLQSIENEFLMRLDKHNQDQEAMHEMFRAIHSIKGSVGIVISTAPGASALMPVFKSIARVVHVFETLMSILRDKELEFTSAYIDLSYDVIDYLKYCIHLIRSEMCEELMDQAILDKIQVCVKEATLLAEEKEKKNKESEMKKIKETVQDHVLQSIRVNQDKVDKLMNMIAELIITKNAFFHIAKKLNVEYDLPELSKEVKEVGFAVNRISEELQDTIMSIRMVEIKTVFQKIPRIVRDVAQLDHKKINLVIEGEGTEIDKTIVEQLSDPLIHMIRNCADHGIEEPEIRSRKGKSETGTILLKAYNKNKNVVIEIEDDGKGIDVEVIKQKAIDKGFIKDTEAKEMSKEALLNLVFLPGFSTAKKVTEVSGRGVGMDVVRNNITRLKGSIHIESEVDKGTKITIRLPLTLAVSRGLLVEVGKESYIIPLDSIVETVKIQGREIHSFNGKHLTHLRGEVVGVEWLGKILLHERVAMDREEFNAVVISHQGNKLAMIVDKLKSEQEIVVKPISECLANIPGISGSTLLGNGQVILILNAADLIHMSSE